MNQQHVAPHLNKSGYWMLLPTLFLLASLLVGCESISAQDYQKIVDDFADRTHFNGAILIARGDSILYAKAYGYENFEDGVPTRPDTRYEVGSLAKWMTSLVVLKLVDQGKLSLTAPIGTYLPGYREDSGRRITLHHLLTNRSGVPNGLIAAYEANPAALDEPLTTSEAVRRYASGDLLFEPGSRFDYSHSNWILVNAIIERATGATFEENVRTLITRPLRLEDTGVFWDGSSDPYFAPGYKELEPVPVKEELPAPEYLVCAGGMYSSAPNLLALFNALYGGLLLSEESLAKLDTVYSKDEDLTYGDHVGGYAYGGRLRAMELGEQVETVLWHTGSNGPSKTRVSSVLSDSLTIITLTNANTSHEETGTLIENVLKSFYH